MKKRTIYMTVTWQTVVSVAAIIAAALALYNYFAKVVRFLDKQKKQDEELADLRKHHDDDMKEIRQELTVLCYGLLSALKGLAEQGCDGPVHDAIDHLEKHLNKRAHE